MKKPLPVAAIVGVVLIVLGLLSQLWPITALGLLIVVLDPIIGSVKRGREQREEMIRLMREQNNRP